MARDDEAHSKDIQGVRARVIYRYIPYSNWRIHMHESGEQEKSKQENKQASGTQRTEKATCTRSPTAGALVRPGVTTPALWYPPSPPPTATAGDSDCGTTSVVLTAALPLAAPCLCLFLVPPAAAAAAAFTCFFCLFPPPVALFVAAELAFLDLVFLGLSAAAAFFAGFGLG